MENKQRIPYMVIELQEFFSTITEYPEDIVYNAYTTIIDVPKFVNTHLTYIVNNADKRPYEPYIERLKVVKEKLSEMQPKKPKKSRKKNKQTEMFD